VVGELGETGHHTQAVRQVVLPEARLHVGDDATAVGVRDGGEATRGGSACDRRPRGGALGVGGLDHDRVLLWFAPPGSELTNVDDDHGTQVSFMFGARYLGYPEGGWRRLHAHGRLPVSRPPTEAPGTPPIP
jgi:hypothetical protein